MQKLILIVLLTVSFAGFAQAQQATGQAAEEAKTEVMKLEKGKVPLLLKGGSAFADWFARYDADDVVAFDGNGTLRTKAQKVDQWRSGAMTQSANNQRDHKVYVYDNGSVVIATYIGTTTDTIGGKTSIDRVVCADTWVKHDGKWLRVVHANARRIAGE